MCPAVEGNSQSRIHAFLITDVRSQLLQPPYSAFVSEMQRLEIRSKVEKVAEVLNSTQVAIDDHHSPKLCASLLKHLLSGGALASEQETIKPTKSTRLTRAASTLRNSAIQKSEPDP